MLSFYVRNQAKHQVTLQENGKKIEFILWFSMLLVQVHFNACGFVIK